AQALVGVRQQRGDRDSVIGLLLPPACHHFLLVIKGVAYSARVKHLRVLVTVLRWQQRFFDSLSGQPGEVDVPHVLGSDLHSGVPDTGCPIAAAEQPDVNVGKRLAHTGSLLSVVSRRNPARGSVSWREVVLPVRRSSRTGKDVG